MTVTGRCNCGSITVGIPALPENSVICYCKNCQRASAGLCSTNYFFDTSDVTINDPNNILKSYKDSDTASGNPITRRFCGNCGCPVVSALGEGVPKIIVKAGMFVHVAKIKEPIKEVFEHEKPEWVKFQAKLL